MVNDIITRAGGVNVVDTPQRLAPFSLEALLQAQPEVYIIQQGPMNRSPEDIYSRPYFQELRAVKANGCWWWTKASFPTRAPVRRGGGTIGPVSPPRGLG